MHILKNFIVFVFIIGNITSISVAAPPVEPIYFYASQTGKQTLDQGEGGGNPFASALVELLARDTLTFDNFRSELIDLTGKKSRGFQRPEIFSKVDLGSWHLLPKPSTEKRIALVLVFSDYTISGARALPGAKNDLVRISKSLAEAKFEVQTAIDPDQSKLNSILKEFSERSKTSDVAVLYTTGHGVEVNGIIYLLPGDYLLVYGKSKLNERAIRLTRIGDAVQASKVNLVFYGGCRNNPFDEP
ncbi:peptidase C14 caspase catalytic subunit p20 [Candidatus Thiomargarita nelsonii]|uniref:Peptidase C14 caspase catalytic subunit p20 n=1 Tax=Candidatus Thiomargarita nelsonii TaxID=1003181 RepID=A0A176RUE1_9GAMM|nr:peptidase C14 caspase catalytic subunit p20 [Candidatus Thiomargarita nelsonii]